MKAKILLILLIPFLSQLCSAQQLLDSIITYNSKWKSSPKVSHVEYFYHNEYGFLIEQKTVIYYFNSITRTHFYYSNFGRLEKSKSYDYYKSDKRFKQLTTYEYSGQNQYAPEIVKIYHSSDSLNSQPKPPIEMDYYSFMKSYPIVIGKGWLHLRSTEYPSKFDQIGRIIETDNSECDNRSYHMINTVKYLDKKRVKEISRVKINLENGDTISTEMSKYFYSEKKLKHFVPFSEDSKIEIFPNPYYHSFNLKVKDPKDAPSNIAIYNSAGQQIESIELNPNELFHRVNLQSLSSGIYFLKIKTPRGFISKRIVKMQSSRVRS